MIANLVQRASSCGAPLAVLMAFAIFNVPRSAHGQQCPTVGTDLTCTNSTVLSGGSIGIRDFGTLTITNTNSGTVVGQGTGIEAAVAANIINFGTISSVSAGSVAVDSTTVRLANYGTISGGLNGVSAGNLAMTNSGTISANTFGVGFFTGTVSNSGTISGFFGIFANSTASVINSGIIIGTGGTAISFDSLFAITPNTLTVLPGSRIIGNILLRGGGDTVNFRGGNQNLTFDTLAGAKVTGATPFAVSGNHAAAIDPTLFASADHALTDFTRGVSSALRDRVGDSYRSKPNSTLGFAATSDAVSSLDALSIVPGFSSYAGDTVAFKNPTAEYSDGTALWARAFAGQRVQQADGVLLRAQNQFFGGMIGGDRLTQSGARFGAFLGGGATHSAVDLSQGDNDSDLAFGGVFGRYTQGLWFFNAILQAGISHTATTRTINNNLAPGGLETARATYDGWYAVPELSVGRVFALGSAAGASYTITPSLQVRYLYGSLGGYAESGSTADLTVGARTAQSFEEVGQLKLTRSQPFASAEALLTSVYGGVLGNQRVGGSTIDAALLGNQIPFATPGKDNVAGGFVGASLEYRADRVSLFVSAEFLSLSDSSSVVSGNGGIRVAF